jgi:hypothetical protein
MKRIHLFFITALVIGLLSSTTTFAQKGHYFIVTTWKLKVPPSGSFSELNSLLKEFSQKVVFPNDKVVSEKVLHHVYGSDMRDLVVTSEYANWDDIEAASLKQDELSKKAWPDKADRQKFYDTWNKYVVTHSDEIYQEIPSLSKK